MTRTIYQSTKTNLKNVKNVNGYVKADGTEVRKHIRNGLQVIHNTYGKGLVDAEAYTSGKAFIKYVVGGGGTHGGRMLSVSRKQLIKG